MTTQVEPSNDWFAYLADCESNGLPATLSDYLIWKEEQA